MTWLIRHEEAVARLRAAADRYEQAVRRFSVLAGHYGAELRARDAAALADDDGDDAVND